MGGDMFHVTEHRL